MCGGRNTKLAWETKHGEIMYGRHIFSLRTLNGQLSDFILFAKINYNLELIAHVYMRSQTVDAIDGAGDRRNGVW